MAKEKNTNDNKKNGIKIKITSTTKKRLMLIIPALIIIILALLLYSPQSIVTSPDITDDVAKAQLFIESGNVQIKKSGEDWTSAEDGIYLYQSDRIKTGDNSAATIVLFRSSVVNLDSNTEVTLKEILDTEDGSSVTLNQESGRTWNTVSKMSGIDDYEVQTPTTIASVRGTSFVVIVEKQNGKTDIGVGRGVVDISKLKNGRIIETIKAEKDKMVTVDPDLLDEPLKLKDFEKDEWILKNLEEDEENLILEKQSLLNKVEPYLDELEERGIIDTDAEDFDQELDALIEGYLLGVWDLPENTPEHLRELFEPET